MRVALRKKNAITPYADVTVKLLLHCQTDLTYEGWMERFFSDEGTN